eukprot:TRINITY_DN5779_c0_g1_i5.p1 TRINITY_DN5779_c0_g1~~TRINITY_DN5779_c0_g1_i5.p1  ORF type:complete len:181 (+),score=37.80 TRINITY_DN5779_c0_g1_i5:127-669(+)
MAKLRSMRAPLDIWAYIGLIRLLRQGSDYISGGPNFKHGIHSLLILDELGLWFPEMDMHIPGRGRWLRPSRRNEQYKQMVTEMKENFLKEGPSIAAVKRQKGSPTANWKEPIPKDPPRMPHLHHFKNMPPSHVFRASSSPRIQPTIPMPSIKRFQTSKRIQELVSEVKRNVRTSNPHDNS